MKFTCPHCKTLLNVPQSALGQKRRCKRCKHIISLPASPDDGVSTLEPAADVDDDLLSQLSHEADQAPTGADDRARPAALHATADGRRPRQRRAGASKLTNLAPLKAVTAVLSVGLLIGWFLPWLDRPKWGPLKDKLMIGPRVAWGGAAARPPPVLDEPEAADRTSLERALTSIGATFFGAGALVAVILVVTAVTQNRPMGPAVPALVVATGGLFLFFVGAGGTGSGTPWPGLLVVLSVLALALTLLQVDWPRVLQGLGARQAPAPQEPAVSPPFPLRHANKPPRNCARYLPALGMGLALVAVCHYPLYYCYSEGRFAISNSGTEVAPMRSFAIGNSAAQVAPTYSFISEAIDKHKKLSALPFRAFLRPGRRSPGPGIISSAWKTKRQFDAMMSTMGSILRGQWVMVIGANICTVGVFLTLVVALGLAADYTIVFVQPFCWSSVIVGCGMAMVLVGYFVMSRAVGTWMDDLPKVVGVTLETKLGFGFYLAAIQTFVTGIVGYRPG